MDRLECRKGKPGSLESGMAPFSEAVNYRGAYVDCSGSAANRFRDVRESVRSRCVAAQISSEETEEGKKGFPVTVRNLFSEIPKTIFHPEITQIEHDKVGGKLLMTYGTSEMGYEPEYNSLACGVLIMAHYSLPKHISRGAGVRGGGNASN